MERRTSPAVLLERPNFLLVVFSKRYVPLITLRSTDRFPDILGVPTLSRLRITNGLPPNALTFLS